MPSLPGLEGGAAHALDVAGHDEPRALPDDLVGRGQAHPELGGDGLRGEVLHELALPLLRARVDGPERDPRLRALRRARAAELAELAPHESDHLLVLLTV